MEMLVGLINLLQGIRAATPAAYCEIIYALVCCSLQLKLQLQQQLFFSPFPNTLL